MSRLIVGDLPRVNAEANPKGVAYVHGDQTSTWSDVDGRVNSLAHALRDILALGEGDVVGVLAANRVECLELMFAASRAKLIHTALKTRGHVKEMVRQVDDAGLRTLFVGPGFEEAAQEIVRSRPGVRPIGLSGATFGEEYEALLSKAPRDPIVSHQDPDAIYSIMYTSGSTGEPKGVAIASRNEITFSWSVAWSLESRHDDVLLHVLPLVHRGGQFFAMTAALLGQPIVLGEPDALAMLEAVQRHRITVLMLVPTIAKSMAEHLEQDPGRFDVSTLRLIAVGSSALSADLARRLMAATSAQICQAAGSSEGGVTMALLGDDYQQIVTNPAVAHRIASVGRPAPGVRVGIVDGEDRFVSDGEVGELVYQADMFVDTYWNRPDMSARAWRGGWFHSGDLGWRDADGYIYYKDRLFGRIKTGSETVFSREVESVLEKHPDVAEVAVVGVPDEHWGEAVAAAIVTKRSTTGREDRDQFTTELVELVRSELARFKVPKRFEFLPALPRTALGKVAYGDLRQSLTE